MAFPPILNTNFCPLASTFTLGVVVAAGVDGVEGVGAGEGVEGVDEDERDDG